MRSILLCNDTACAERVYSEKTVVFLKKQAGLDDKVYTKSDILSSPQNFSDVDFIFSTWSMPEFKENEIKEIFGNLKCVFYAAGTVQRFARPFLKCGVKVFSAWAANAIPVAEYTVAQIILANKGFFPCSYYQSLGEVPKSKEIFKNYPGNFGEYIGIIGAGMIGKLVIKLLKPYNLNILVFDPFLPDETAEELGVTKCELDEIFKKCPVISNHLANNAQTQGMLNLSLFEKMRPYSTFINTGRGAQVVENDLVDILKKRPDIYAILDVTMPEPPISGHEFYKLPNCILTPHIAGSSGSEVHRMAEYMAEEFNLYIEKKPLRYEVTEKMLATMA